MSPTSTAEPSSAMKQHPNWLEMPHDLMADILQRLGTVEILMSARKVCTTWRRICNDPAMWKVIYVHKTLFASITNYDFEKLTKKAVDLSCGELIDISIVFLGSNDLLDYIVLRSKKLKRLYLMSNITGSCLSQAVKRLPQLDELCISVTTTNVEDIKAIGQNCPQLKYFMLDKRLTPPKNEWDNDDDALTIASNMRELRGLKLIDKSLTNDGLKAILDGCPHLESVDVRMCYNLHLYGNFGKLCMERIRDFKSDFHTRLRGSSSNS